MAYDLTTTNGIDERARKARKRMNKLFSQFANFRIYCQTIAELFWPERADFTVDRTQGMDMQDGLFTGAMQTLRRDFGNRLGAVTRPPNQQWFSLVAKPDEMMKDDSIRYWCDTATRIQRRTLYNRNANYADAMSISDQDFVTFGNAVTWCAYNKMQTGLVFRNAHLRDCAWAVNEYGLVDELYEKIKMPLGHAIRMFGLERLPQDWQRRAEKPEGLLEDVTVIRGAIPIDPDDYPGYKPPKGKRCAILYFTDDCKSGESGALGESYCELFPYNVRRWMPLGEPFGRSLCTTVGLADARSLNVAEMAALKAIEMVTDPPRWADDEAVIGEVELKPGGVTFIDSSSLATGRDPLGKIEGGDPRYVMDFLVYKRNQMAVQWFETLWKFPDREMTAYEAAERMDIMTQDATPVFQPIEADNARQMDVVFSKISAKNGFPPPPEGLLLSGEADWEFETPVSASLKRARAMKARNIIDNVMVAKQVWPDFGDNIDRDALEREMLQGMGPDNWILPAKEVEAQRAARDEAQRQAQMEQDMVEGGKAALNAKPENLRAVEQAIE